MQGRVNAAGAIAALGAVALLVGLSLDWFEPQVSGWSAFEIVDLVLAAIAIGVVIAIFTASVERPAGDPSRRWLPLVAGAALVLVLASMVNPPPAAADRSLQTGAWVSLAGALILTVGTVLATTSVSVVVTMRPLDREPPAREHDTDEEEVLGGFADEEAEGVDEGVVPGEEGSETETRPLRRER